MGGSRTIGERRPGSPTDAATGTIVVMPDFIPPEAVRFGLRDGRAVLRLAFDPAAAEPAVADGPWSMFNRMTMCVLDGPADAGFLLARLGPDGTDLAPPGWDEAVERDGGTVVVFGDQADAPSIFVPLLPRRSRSMLDSGRP
jgi:hypothetical protein